MKLDIAVALDDGIVDDAGWVLDMMAGCRIALSYQATPALSNCQTSSGWEIFSNSATRWSINKRLQRAACRYVGT
jgi:hypothetical protein